MVALTSQLVRASGAALPASSSQTAPSSAGAGRRDFPSTRLAKRPKREDVIQTAATPQDRDLLIARLVKGMGAPSSRASTSSLWTTWADFHVRMAGGSVPVLPLTVSKVFLVTALFKEGGYRAYKTYQSKAKDMHILASFAWGVQLDLAFRKSALSVLRGLGVSRQSAPLDLTLALQKATEQDFHWDGGAPVGWANLLVLPTYFVMREIEVTAALAALVSIDEASKKVTLRLPDTKTDYKAVGCSRSWACLCSQERPRRDCPFCAAAAQLRLLTQLFGGPLPSRLPLFPTAAGMTCKKVDVVKALETTLVAAWGGCPERVRGAPLRRALLQSHRGATSCGPRRGGLQDHGAGPLG